MARLTKIEIWWKGPFTKEEVKEFDDEDTCFGLYQIYGTHNVNGPNTLLYIGQANYQTFAKRVGQHEWTDWEPSDTQFYLGFFGGTKKVTNKQWEEQISIAERLLIFFCAPPYNSQGLKNYGDIKNTIVLNFDKKNQLPSEVSTFYYETEFWEGDWYRYGEERDE